MAPSQELIDWALRVAARPGCIKSRRSVVIFDPLRGVPVAAGRNAQPLPFRCDGSAACRRDCNKLCVHAEQVALSEFERGGFSWIDRSGSREHFQFVHVKSVDGELVPSGGPSCWQCSRAILESGLGGVWLYEKPVGAWTFYKAADFHRATLRACGMYENTLPAPAGLDSERSGAVPYDGK